MARAPGKKPKLAVVGGSSTPGIGHNALTEEQAQKLHLGNHVPAYERALKAKKDADAAFKNVCKVIKSEGGSVAEVKRTIDLRTPEGEARLKADIEASLRVARWNGLAIGTQGDIFGPDRRPVEERAFDDGKRDGMAGKTLAPPHAPDTAAYQRYVEGWHAGQAVNAKGITAGPAPASGDELLRKEGAEASGKPDEFDAAAAGSTTTA